MIWPLSETLNFIQPYLPRPLVAAETLAQVKAIAQLLPEAISAHYLECRLGAAATSVDFAACVIAARGGREIFTSSPWPQILRDDPLWSRVYNLFKDWADPTSLLYNQIPLVWLGFDDTDKIMPLVPLPCLSLCLDPDYLTDKPSPKQPDTRLYQQITETAFERLLGHPLQPQTRHNLANCFDLLPPGGQICYISVMLARHPPALKLNGLIPKDKLLDYLTQLGWSGSIIELEQILTRYCGFLDRIRFDLTIGPTISPRLGFEFFSKGSPISQAQQQLLVNQLITDGLGTPEKGQALLAWSGLSSELFSRHSRPTRLSRSWYVKIVYQPDHPLEAKGYLGFTPNFFTLFSLV